MVLVNPTIVGRSDETNIREEGCLSFPQINGNVERSITIDVEYQTLSGEKKEVKLQNLPARISSTNTITSINYFSLIDLMIGIIKLTKSDLTNISKYGPGGAP